MYSFGIQARFISDGDAMYLLISITGSRRLTRGTNNPWTDALKGGATLVPHADDEAVSATTVGECFKHGIPHQQERLSLQCLENRKCSLKERLWSTSFKFS